MSELSQEAQRLIEEVAQADGPSAADRERMRNKIALELGAAAFATTAVGAASATALSTASAQGTSALSAAAAGTKTGAAASGLFAKLALASSVLGALGAGALISYGASTSTAPQATRPERAHAPISRVPEAQSAAKTSTRRALAPVVTPLAEPPRAVEAEPADESATPHAQARTQHEKPSPEALHLADEVALLTRAQAALREGRFADALALAREHASRFPRGALREERLGMLALARCGLGENGAEVVRELLRAAPSSPLLERVREACARAPKEPTP